MKTRKLLAAAVAAITVLVGGLGMALWPSSAGATGSVRKFTGPLYVGATTSSLLVKVHNPHATSTFKPSVVVRSHVGVVTLDYELTAKPNSIATVAASCKYECTVEVNMPNTLLQPSILYFSLISNQDEYIYAGDFSR